jgi:ketosteroid isomerase-like protein
MNSLQIAEQFVVAINAHNIEGIVALMTRDHRFTDSLGNVVEGRESMRGGWAAYFEMVPDYNLTIEKRFVAAENTEEVVLVGMAYGSYANEGHIQAGSAWSTPIAVRAAVRHARISEWRVYADNQPIREQIRATSA